MRQFIFLSFLYLSIPVYSFSQSTPSCWLNGYILDARSGETLVGANVFLPESSKGVVSDNYGHYSLGLTCGNKMRLQVSYVGYQTIDTFLVPNGELRFDFKLKLQDLQEVVVLDKVGSLQHNTLQIPIERLKAVPMLFGQPDVIKALSFLPGVTTGVEGTTGLYVRGGTPDQNLILLDGATVYNASHLFGFQSVFDPAAIKDIKLIKGGFPARYGGRLSSIIDITMKEGNNQQKHQEFTLGVINSGLMLEGPIKKGASSYMFSGRAAYLGLLLLPTAINWKKKDDKPFNTLLSYDLNFKINQQFKNKDKIFVSAYIGNDNYLTRFRADSAYFRTTLQWGNKTASVRYLHAFSKKVFSQSIVSYNAYVSREYDEIEDVKTHQMEQFLRKSEIRDLSFKQLFSIDLFQNFHVSTGFELLHQYFSPSSLSLSNGELNLDSISKKNQIFRPFTWILFAEAEWDPLKWLKINAGLRQSNYQVEQTNRNFFEPRLNLTARQGRFSYNLAYAYTSQFVHLLANNSLGLYSDLWVPSTNAIAPQVAQQYSGGVIYHTPSRNWEFSMEAYYKTLNNQIDYRQGIDFFDVNNFNWQNAIEKNGIGRAKGLEWMVKRETTKFNAWLSYTLSKNERQFATINHGDWYPFKYDKRHNISLNLVKKMKKDWTFGLNFIYQTGGWITFQSGVYRENIIGLDYLREINLGPHIRYVLEGRNNQHLPDNHRVDLSFTKNFQSHKHKGSSALNFSVYNAYARKNPYTLNASSGLIYINGKITDSFFTIRGQALFTIIPALSYTKRW